jgi:hypothetical protein
VVTLLVKWRLRKLLFSLAKTTARPLIAQIAAGVGVTIYWEEEQDRGKIMCNQLRAMLCPDARRTGWTHGRRRWLCPDETWD